jgi:hypothetical protein
MTGNKSAGLVLQDRDRHLLREIAGMRIIDRELAKAVAGFQSTRRANARLLALMRAGLLRRFFWGTIAGGRKAIYSLSPKAAPIVDRPYRTFQRKPDQTLVGDLFVAHQLEINHIFVALKYRQIPISGVSFRRWIYFARPLSQTTPIIPDGYFELNTSQGVRGSFLEVDRGTEPQVAWQKKIEAYLRYAITGEFAQEFGQKQFRVLVIANSERRINWIRRTAAKVTEKVFWFSNIESINRDGLWSPVWFRPSGDQRQSLF